MTTLYHQLEERIRRLEQRMETLELNETTTLMQNTEIRAEWLELQMADGRPKNQKSKSEIDTGN